MQYSSSSCRRVVAFTVVAVLLQLGAVSVAMPAHPAQAAGSAPALHDATCTADSCPDGMCSPGQCLMGATTSCHCSCMQLTTESISELRFQSSTATTATTADAAGSTAGRLDKPFRPPA